MSTVADLETQTPLSFDVARRVAHGDVFDESLSFVVLDENTPYLLITDLRCPANPGVCDRYPLATGSYYRRLRNQQQLQQE